MSVSTPPAAGVGADAELTTLACGWSYPGHVLDVDLAAIGMVVPRPGQQAVLRAVEPVEESREIDAAVSLELRARAIARVREPLRARGGYTVEILHTCLIGDPLCVEVVYRVTATVTSEREQLARQVLRSQAAMREFWRHEVQTEPEGSVTLRVARAKVAQAEERYLSAYGHWQAALTAQKEACQ